MFKPLQTCTLTLTVALLAACSTPQKQVVSSDGSRDMQQSYNSSGAAVTSVRTGFIKSTRNVATNNSSSGLGTVAGVVVGGLLGSAIGSGSGQVLATVGGAVAGGYAGNRIEKSQNSKRMMMEVNVKFRDGGSHTYLADPGMGLRTGQRVKVITSGDDVQIVRY